MAIETVQIGPFRIADLSYRDCLCKLVEMAGTGQRLAYALHIGGLTLDDDDEYAQATEDADIHYADGIAVVNLARRAGAVNIERSPTTDLAPDLLRLLPEGTRIGLIGGPPGLAKLAGLRLEEEFGVQVVFALHGYGEAQPDVLQSLPTAAVVFVGLGAPLEMKWVQQNRAILPPALIVTCGGWFGFVLGRETRAPRFVQAIGGEWAWRLAHSPGRLGRRYLLGARKYLTYRKANPRNDLAR